MKKRIILHKIAKKKKKGRKGTREKGGRDGGKERGRRVKGKGRREEEEAGEGGRTLQAERCSKRIYVFNPRAGLQSKN